MVVIYPNHDSITDLPHGIYNVYFLVPDAGVARYDMYEVCRFCNAGEDHVEWSNVWRYDGGFRKPVVLRESFHGSFNGAKLRMGRRLVDGSAHARVKYYKRGSSLQTCL